MNTPVTIPSWLAALAIVAIILSGVVCVNLHYGNKHRLDRLEKQVEENKGKLGTKVNVTTYKRQRAEDGKHTG